MAAVISFIEKVPKICWNSFALKITAKCVIFIMGKLNLLLELIIIHNVSKKKVLCNSTNQLNGSMAHNLGPVL